MREEKNPENNFYSFINNFTKVYKDLLYENYQNCFIKIVSIKENDKWNIIYFLLKFTASNQKEEEIIYSINKRFIFYKKLISLEEIKDYFVKISEEWSYRDNDLIFLFTYPLNIDISFENFKKKLECNCSRQKLKYSKQMHIEYYDQFSPPNGFSFKPFYEDYFQKNKKLINVSSAIINFLGFKLNNLCNPGIFIIYPIESFTLSIETEFNSSDLKLTLKWDINENYRHIILPTYEKDNQINILDKNEKISVPYSFSGQIKLIFKTLKSNLCPSNEDLFFYILNFPKFIIEELINKIEIINTTKEYSRYYEIIKKCIKNWDIPSRFRDEIRVLNLDALLYVVSGNEYKTDSWISPHNKERLQNKKRKLKEFLESIKKHIEGNFKEIGNLKIETGYSDMDAFIKSELSEKLPQLKFSNEVIKDFIELLNFLVNKMVYNQNHREFLQDKADEWFKAHSGESRKEMETKFFHPFIRRILKEKFGEDIFDTPKEARGHVDLKFYSIPIELKVLTDENSRNSENLSGIELLEKKHLQQIKGEIINNRIGFLVGLDYRKNINPELISMPNREYLKFIRNSYQNSQILIVLLIFSANKKPPSKL